MTVLNLAGVVIRRSAMRFRLQSVLLLMLCLCILLAIPAAQLHFYRRQAEIASELRREGVAVETAPDAPGWMNPFLRPEQRLRIVGVELPVADADAALLRMARYGSLKLERIKINGCALESRRALTSRGVQALAGFPELKSLSVFEIQVLPNALKPLHELPQLEELSLSSCGIRDEHLKEISTLGSLREVGLTFNFVTDDGIQALTSLPRLEQLHVDYTAVTHEGAAWLKARNPPLIVLVSGHRNLDLSDLAAQTDRVRKGESATIKPAGSIIADDDLSALGSLRGVEALLLSGTYVEGPGLRYLTDWESLRELDLSNCPVGDQGLPHVARFKYLRKLRLRRTDVTAQGLLALRELASLEELDLRTTRIGDEVGPMFAAMRHLEYLDLSHTNVTDEVLSQVAHIRSLVLLDLYGTRTTEQSIHAIEERIPGIIVGYPISH
jgi:internalin A